MTRDQLQTQYAQNLQNIGYHTEIDEDSDIFFQHEGNSFYIPTSQNDDPLFFRIIMPKIWVIATPGEHAKALQVINTLNLESKAAKIAISQNNTVSVSSENFALEDDKFHNLPRKLTAISSTAHSFAALMNNSPDTRRIIHTPKHTTQSFANTRKNIASQLATMGYRPQITSDEIALSCNQQTCYLHINPNDSECLRFIITQNLPASTPVNKALAAANATALSIKTSKIIILNDSETWAVTDILAQGTHPEHTVIKRAITTTSFALQAFFNYLRQNI